MKNIAKRFLSAAIAVIILIGLSPVNSFKIKSSAAEETTLSGTCGENVTYSLNENTGVLTISGTGKMADYSDDSHSPFYENEKIKEVIIEDGVTGIGSFTFYGCSSLTSITIPKGVTSIGGLAFYNCSSLTSIVIPEVVTSIGDFAFVRVNNIIYNGSLSGSPWGAKCINGYIEDGLVYKDSSKKELLGCSSSRTESVSIPNSVEKIGESAFYNCSSLTSITIPKGVTSIGKHVFFGCSGLTSITIPEGVTSIGSSAFYGCSSLEDVEIPNGLKNIGNYSFENCNNLIRINIPESVVYVGGFAFRNCSKLTSLFIPNENAVVESGAFKNCCNLTKISLPNNLTVIEGDTFSGCSSLTDITIPDNVTSICFDAFNNCSNLIELNIPNSVTNIETGAFENCRLLKKISISDNVTYIGWYTFKGCSNLTDINLPDKLTHIGISAFEQCISLTSIEIPDGVKTIDSSAFENCKGLTDIKLPNSLTSISSHTFDGCSSLINITIPNNVESIKDCAFRGCTRLSNITLPQNLISIGFYAFVGCKSLVEIMIPDSTNYIDFCAFRDCKSLSSIVIPNSITSIERGVFQGCSSLANVMLPDNITSIGAEVFYNCYNLVDITLPENVTSIGYSAFANCEKLKDVYYYGTEEKWSSMKIYNDNDQLKNATIHYLYGEVYKITLNANGGTCDTNTISLKYGDEITLPIPIKEDCEFLGWYTELEGGERISDSTAITSDMTLYAHWYSVCKFKISSVEATAGDVIEVPVKIVNNKGIMGFSAQILYDNSVLTPIEVKKGAAFSGGNIVSNLEKLTPGELKIVGYSAKESRVDDIIYTVAFKVSDSAEGVYKLRLSYDPDNTFDGDLNEVSLQCEDGSVDVKKNTADRTLIYMEDQNTICGNEISIPIKIKNQKELQAVSFNFEYDSAVLDFVSVTSDFDNISYSQNGKSIAISLSSLDKCKDETPIAYVNLVAKSVAETVVKLSSDNDIDVNNGIVSVKENYSTKPTLYADNVVGKVDSTVKVPICIKNNPGISGFKIKISYDPTALQPESLIAGASFPAIYDNLGRKNGEISAIWIESSGKNVVNNGEIFNINFKILKKGTHEISVTYSKADTFNEKSEELNLICRSGNVFAGNLLMPKEGTSIVIDYSNKYIYGIDAGIQSIKPYVYTDEGYTISEITAKQGFGTSAKVNLMLENDVVETYTVVLFGDVNGDGWYDGQDAVLVNMIANGMLTREQVGEAVWMAADCNHDGVIDQGDVDLLNRAGLLLSKVDQTKPT